MLLSRDIMSCRHYNRHIGSLRLEKMNRTSHSLRKPVDGVVGFLPDKASNRVEVIRKYRKFQYLITR